MTNDRPQKNDWLYKYQLSFWCLALTFGLIISLLLFLKVPIAKQISHWALISMMVLTVGRLLVLALQFKSEGDKTFMIWSYAFMIILAASIYFGINFK